MDCHFTSEANGKFYSPFKFYFGKNLRVGFLIRFLIRICQIYDFLFRRIGFLKIDFMYFTIYHYKIDFLKYFLHILF